jgi:rhamnosyltransferase
MDRDLPKFAVGLAAYNGIRWIEEQVDSILAQIGVQVTIFVSVDLSTDGTETWVKERARREPRLILLPPAGRFGGAARNFYRLILDIDLDKFDYLSLADQDDIWFDDKLLRAHEQIRSRWVDVYSSNVLAFWPDGRERLIDKSQPQREWDFLFEAAGPGCTYVFKREVGQALQDLIRTHWEEVNRVWLHDWLFYAFSRVNGYGWFIDHRPGLRYRQHGSNQVGVNLGWCSLMGRLQKIKSGWARNQCAQIASLAGILENHSVRHALGNGRRGNLFLALHFRKARRSAAARIGFFFLCLLNLF